LKAGSLSPPTFSSANVPRTRPGGERRVSNECTRGFRREGRKGEESERERELGKGGGGETSRPNETKRKKQPEHSLLEN
jgi:hypothetical protein